MTRRYEHGWLVLKQKAERYGKYMLGYSEYHRHIKKKHSAMFGRRFRSMKKSNLFMLRMYARDPF